MRSHSPCGRGFTLIELLIVIAIIAVLAALLFSVFGKARAQARQATCISNQRQIAIAILTFAQDHKERLPTAVEVWPGIDLPPKTLVCPTAGRAVRNAYVYDGTIAGRVLANCGNSSQVFLTADGRADGNLAETVSDLQERHTGKLVATFGDGHVELRPAAGLLAAAPSGPTILTHNPKDGAELRYIPAGTFTMGEIGIATSTHMVTLTRNYYIYKTEVTVGQYQAFCSDTGRRMPSLPGYTPAWPCWSGHENYPMVKVSWQDAADYAAWANASLPTEAQWEYAARGPSGNSWPWGNTWDVAKCNTWDDTNAAGGGLNGQMTAPVGSYPAGASWCGAQDLAGNVWEWCAGWSGPYTADAQIDPTGPSSGPFRTLRGGSWYGGDSSFFRGAYRCDNSLTRARYGVGFRCVFAAPGPK